MPYPKWSDEELQRKCICGRSFGLHHVPLVSYAHGIMTNWNCPDPNGYEAIPRGSQGQFTPISAVATSKVSIARTEPKEVDVSDWKTWRHNVPGECVCGIPKERCTYHR
jgi:hypothetical protein